MGVEMIEIGLLLFNATFAQLAGSMGKHFEMRKPFSCAFCLTFWFSIPLSIAYIYNADLTILAYIGYALTTRQILWSLVY